MDTDNIIKDIMEITKQLRPDMWGIRSTESGKLLAIGLIGDRVLFCDSSCMAQAYLWNKKEDVDKVFSMLSELGKNLKFKETHKVDEASEEEKTAWLNPSAP